jgi:hypothetical protein
MSVVRKFRPPNRLTAMIKDRGGVLAKDALVNADTALEPLRAPSLAVLDAALTEIEARFGLAAAATRNSEDFETLYTLTLKILDVANFAGPGVDHAAASLCTLVDAQAEAGAWRWEAVDVHLNALRLLRNLGAKLPDAHRRSLLEGLQKVSQRKSDES